MSRSVSGWAAGCTLAAVLAACGGDDGGSGPGGSGPAGGDDGCAQYASCGACTPVVGCGWCFGGSGGQCASHPDECAFSSDNEFTWTWEPSGCPTVDASVVPVADAESEDAGAADGAVFVEASALDGGEAGGG